MQVLARINRYLLILSALSLMLVVLLTVADVVTTNFRGRPILGAYEIVETAIVFLVFLGLPETFRAEQNITVDIVDHYVPPAVVAWLRIAGAAASVVYLVLLLWSMIGPARDAYRFGDFKADLGIPFTVLWAPILFGTVMAIIAAIFVMRSAVFARRIG